MAETRKKYPLWQWVLALSVGGVALAAQLRPDDDPADPRDARSPTCRSAADDLAQAVESNPVARLMGAQVQAVGPAKMESLNPETGVRTCLSRVTLSDGARIDATFRAYVRPDGQDVTELVRTKLVQ